MAPHPWGQEGFRQGWLVTVPPESVRVWQEEGGGAAGAELGAASSTVPAWEHLRRQLTRVVVTNSVSSLRWRRVRGLEGCLSQRGGGVCGQRGLAPAQLGSAVGAQPRPTRSAQPRAVLALGSVPCAGGSLLLRGTGAGKSKEEP